MQGIATLPYEVQEQPFIPTGGLETMRSAAEMLADFGRNGDTYIVHAAEGETMVPMEVLDENPRLKQMLFTQMEDMGIEPERYIVGSELNSINPVTGQPEFFLKKIFRKISRGVKKIVKKIAPVVLPIALSFALGPIYGSALGSGITTLLQGGSLKDAAKSALISGAIGGVTAGFSGPASGSGSFMKNVKFAAGNPLQAGALQTDRLFGSTGGIGGLSYDNPYGFGMSGSGAGQVAQVSAADAADKNAFMTEGSNPVKAVKVDATAGAGAGAGIDKPIVPSEKSFMEKYLYDPAKATVDPKTGAVSGEGTLESIFSPNRASIDPAIQQQIARGEAAQALSTLGDSTLDLAAKKAITDQASAKIAEAATAGAPSFLTKAAPSLYAAGAAGTAALALTYTDDDDDGVDDSTGLTLDEYKAQYPDRFFDDRFYGDNPYYQEPTFYTPPAMYAAGGGAINGPGTPTSDSIPAMLSDGEFVMNAKAVRGAGGGDRRAGAQRMYDMMRSLERRG
jgi:hypothetical protein